MGSVNLASFTDAAFQAWRRLVERRPVTLTLAEEEVRKLAFRDLPAGTVLQVLRLGSLVTGPGRESPAPAGGRGPGLSRSDSGRMARGLEIVERHGQFLQSAIVSDQVEVKGRPVR